MLDALWSLQLGSLRKESLRAREHIRPKVQLVLIQLEHQGIGHGLLSYGQTYIRHNRRASSGRDVAPEIYEMTSGFMREK